MGKERLSALLATACIVVPTLLAGCTFTVTVDDASYRVSVRPVAPEATPTPTATATAPPPTVTSTATPTATKPPHTLEPTLPPASPTPTQEVTLPTPTATTTPRPTSEKGNCIVKLGGTAINERKAPSTSAARTEFSPIPAGSMVAVFEFRTAEGYLWAKNWSGQDWAWFVVRQLSPASWWVTFTAATLEWCLELPGYPSGVQPPNPIVRALPGVWAGPGANRDELLRFGVQVRAAGQPAATVYGEPYTAELLLANGWFVLLRAATAPDCPEMDIAPATSAQRFTTRVLDALGANARAQVVVLANECALPSAAWARDWVRAAAQTAAGRGVRALVPIVWNPGAPELDWVPVLAPAYRDASIVVIWGVNTYPVRVGTGLAVRDAYTQYTTWRYELYRHHLRGVPIVMTEYARGDGSEPPDFADIRAWWGLARLQVDVATAWYVSGPPGLSHWIAANLTGRLTDMATALQ